MEQLYALDSFLQELFLYLTGQDPTGTDLNVFRKHNHKLNTAGEISFPLNSNPWKRFTNKNNPISKDFSERDFTRLAEASRNWTLSITNCSIESNKKLNIFLNRTHTFSTVINSVLKLSDKYGFNIGNCHSQIQIRLETSGLCPDEADLSHLRLNLLRDVTLNLLKATGHVIDERDGEIIYLTNKSVNKLDCKAVVCGVVIGSKFGKKNTGITAEEFYRKRTIDMRLMAQHKYGVRVNSETGWTEFFGKLGSAAVAIDLLHVKPSHTLVINIDNPVASNSKGASFILYNCARLASIFKQFDQKVANGVYPTLPNLIDVDWSLLNQPEEWELLYVYIAQFPQVVNSCVRDIKQCKLNVHNLCNFLDSLCSLFSVYYRRIRILMEPRTHLFPVISARMHLMKAIQQVLHNALNLLNISPVKQM